MKLVDDVVLEGDTIEEVLAKVEMVFKRCREHGIILSEEKIQVGQKIKFGGYYVDASSGEVKITPDPDLLKDIREFPKPTTLRQLRSFQGLVNQVTSWNPDIAQHMSGLRQLLKRNTTYVWDDISGEAHSLPEVAWHPAESEKDKNGRGRGGDQERQVGHPVD